MNKAKWFLFKATAATAGIALVHVTYEVGKVIGKKVRENREENKTKSK